VRPTDIAVASATELVTDGALILPGRAGVRGDVRSFRPEVSAAIEGEIRWIAAGVSAHGCV
jgi:hypothetical protein